MLSMTNSVIMSQNDNSNAGHLMVKKDIHISDTKQFKCATCSALLTTSSDLRRHERTHYTEKPFHCSFPKCLYSAYQNANLLTHEKTHRSIESRLSHICPLCKKGVSSKSILTRHQKTCDGKTREQKSLKTQANICSVCQKHFSTTHKLNNHKKSHTGELPFKCNVCKKAFSSNEALVKHALIHGEKSFWCNYCEWKGVRKDHLHQHMRVHLKEQKKQNCESDTIIDREKPLDYLCGICGKTFSHSQKEVLLQHLASHHPGNSQSSVHTSFHDIVTYEECDTGKIVLATSVASPQSITEYSQAFILKEAYLDNSDPSSQHLTVHGEGREQYILQQEDGSHVIVYHEDTEGDAREMMEQVIVSDGRDMMEGGHVIVSDGRDMMEAGQVIVSDMMEGGHVVVSDGREMMEAGHVIVSDGREMMEASQVIISDGRDMMEAGQVIISDGRDMMEAGQVIVGNNSLISLPHLAIVAETGIVVGSSNEEENTIAQNDDCEGNLIIVESDRLLVETDS